MSGLKRLLYGLENYQGIVKRMRREIMLLIPRQAFRQWLCLGGPCVPEVVLNNRRDFLVMKIFQSR